MGQLFVCIVMVLCSPVTPRLCKYNFGEVEEQGVWLMHCAVLRRYCRVVHCSGKALRSRAKCVKCSVGTVS